MAATTLGPYRYDLTPEEVRAYARRARGRDRARHPGRSAWPSVLGIVVFLGLAYLLLGTGKVSLEQAATAMLVGPLCFIAGQWLYYYEQRRAVTNAEAEQENGLVPKFKQITVTIRDDAIAFATPSTAASYRWDMITEVELAEQFLWLWLDDKRAIALPERVFRDAAERDATLAFARTHARPMNASATPAASPA